MISARRLYAFSLRHLYPLKRDFDLLSDMVYWPIVDVLLWGLTSRWLGIESGISGLMLSILTALIIWNIIWRSQSEISRNIIDEIWNYNLVNLLATPLSIIEWIVGVILLSVGKTAVTVAALAPIIWILYSVNIFGIGWWLIPFFIGGVITGWWIGFISAGIILRWGPKFQTVVWTLPGILLPFSAVFFPLDVMPEIIRPISYLIPTTYIFEGMRSLVTVGTLEVWTIVLSFALNLFYLIPSIAWFIYSYRFSLRLGLGRFT